MGWIHLARTYRKSGSSVFFSSSTHAVPVTTEAFLRVISIVSKQIVTERIEIKPWDLKANQKANGSKSSSRSIVIVETLKTFLNRGNLMNVVLTSPGHDLAKLALLHDTKSRIVWIHFFRGIISSNWDFIIPEDDTSMSPQMRRSDAKLHLLSIILTFQNYALGIWAGCNTMLQPTLSFPYQFMRLKSTQQLLLCMPLTTHSPHGSNSISDNPLIPSCVHRIAHVRDG